MKITVTQDDIQGFSHAGADNPITRAMRRATGRSWVVFGGSTAFLRAEPYHTIALPYAVYAHWKLHQSTGAWKPFEFEVDLRLPEHPRRSGDRRRQLRRAEVRAGSDRRRSDRRATERRSAERRAGVLSAS
jgi:hypothetical protein